VGKDPNWDWKHGRYNYSEGFQRHLQQNSNPQDTDFGPDIGPIVQQQQQQQQQQLQKKG
jgi:hypothetical protein